MNGTSDAATPAEPRRGSVGLLLALVVIVGLAGYVAYMSGIFTPRLKIAVITSGDGPYWDRVLAGAKDAADQLDVDLTIERIKTDVDLQSHVLQDVLSRGQWDGIAISPISMSRQTVLFGRAAAVTTIVTMDSDLPVTRRLCFVGTDNYMSGRQMGEQIRRAVPEGGDIAIAIGQSDKENTLRRRQGLIDELCDRTVEPLRPFDPLNQLQAGKSYRVVETLVDLSDPAKATELAAEAIRKHPNLKCLAGLLSYSAPAHVAAVEQENASSRIKVIGFDVSDATLQLIEQGKVAATTMQDQYGLGFHSVRILADNARHNIGGLPMFQQHALPSDTVTQENVALARQRLAGRSVSLAAGLPTTSPNTDSDEPDEPAEPAN